ncbi:Uncharacterized protein Fot_02130 [Forsythia ovata]|uniref:Uncharacterized protein n=1 Tax=Forsythia ovata TaxID=205694 RepID=A0ABD1X6J2_9LAMI
MEKSIADAIQAVRQYPPRASNSGPASSKLDDRNNTPLSIVDPVDQDADKSTTKRMKICSNESFAGLNTFEDDLVFSEEDLITIDKSAEQHRLDDGEIDVQAVQLYKYATEKPDIQGSEAVR